MRLSHHQSAVVECVYVSREVDTFCKETWYLDQQYVTTVKKIKLSGFVDFPVNPSTFCSKLLQPGSNNHSGIEIKSMTLLRGKSDWGKIVTQYLGIDLERV